MIKIIEAKSELQYALIATLADTIWTEHYIPIIGKDQVDYMLAKYQSETAIANQIKEGFQYYLITYENVPVGYLSFIKESESLFLSKIYVLSDYRGKKIGKSALSFVDKKALESNCKSVTLTVNKNNANSIRAYEKIGFINRGPIVKDIGNGFIMDDFKMEKPLVN